MHRKSQQDVDANLDELQLMNDENDENSEFDVRRIDGREAFGTNEG